jgi:hypothetical protein
MAIVWQGNATDISQFSITPSVSEKYVIKSIYLEFTGTFSGTRVVEISLGTSIIMFKRSITDTDKIVLEDLNILLSDVNTEFSLKFSTTATSAEGGLSITAHGVSYTELSNVDNTSASVPRLLAHGIVSQAMDALSVPSGKSVVIKEIWAYNPNAMSGNFVVGIRNDSLNIFQRPSYYFTDLNPNSGVLIQSNIPYNSGTTDIVRFTNSGATNTHVTVFGWVNGF